MPSRAKDDSDKDAEFRIWHTSEEYGACQEPTGTKQRHYIFGTWAGLGSGLLGWLLRDPSPRLSYSFLSPATMRWAALPVALTASLLPLCISAAQVPWSQPTTASTTVVDVLGADPDYVSLLKLLQRSRLIPTLNRLEASTIFAPTNDAVKRYADKDSLWKSILEDDSFVVTDNIQERLRQQLFYHLLNYTLPSTSSFSGVQTHDTLHYPSLGLQPPSREPPPNPPWMPVPGGSLGGKPQRIRVASDDASVRVGVDAFGRGGANWVKKAVDASNGVVIGIDTLLDPPSNLGLSFASSLGTHVTFLYPSSSNN